MIQTAPNMQTQPRIFNKFQLCILYIYILYLCSSESWGATSLPYTFFFAKRTLPATVPSMCSCLTLQLRLFSRLYLCFSEVKIMKVNPSMTPGRGILHVSKFPPERGSGSPSYKSTILPSHTGCFVYWNPSWILPNQLDMSRDISKKNSINTGNRNAPAVSMDSMDVGCRLDVIGLSISFNWKPRKMRRWKSNPSYDSLNYRNPGVQFSLVDLICMSRISLHLCIFKYISSHVVTTCFIVFPYMQAKNKAASHIFTWKSDLILTAYTIHIHQKNDYPPSFDQNNLQCKARKEGHLGNTSRVYFRHSFWTPMSTTPRLGREFHLTNTKVKKRGQNWDLQQPMHCSSTPDLFLNKKVDTQQGYPIMNPKH